MRDEALRWFDEALWDLDTARILHRERRLLTRYYNRLGETPPNDLMTYARELDRHYIPSRYPNAHPSGEQNACSEATQR